MVHISDSRPDSYLEGQLLIAMPGMGDPRFERAIVYMCVHNEQSAMGLIVNKAAPSITFRELLEQVDIETDLLAPHTDIPVLFGGPVETERGFVLHSRDYHSEGVTLPVSDTVALTASVDILKAIVQGQGPARAIMALGYSGWGPGQLEGEIRANGWLHGPSDDELLFSRELDEKWPAALAKIGVDLSNLSSDAGHA